MLQHANPAPPAERPPPAAGNYTSWECVADKPGYYKAALIVTVYNADGQGAHSFHGIAYLLLWSSSAQALRSAARPVAWSPGWRHQRARAAPAALLAIAPLLHSPPAQLAAAPSSNTTPAHAFTTCLPPCAGYNTAVVSEKEMCEFGYVDDQNKRNGWRALC